MAGKVIVLLLALTLLPPTVTAAAARQATPSPDQDAPTQGVTTDRLIESTIKWTDMPRSADTLALTRVTLSPKAKGAATNGAHLFVIEAGALTVQEYVYFPPTDTSIPFVPFVPAGPPVTYRAGDQFRLSGSGPVPPEITNEGTEPAVALVVSIAGSGGYGLDVLLTGWAAVEPLATEDPARVASYLAEPGPLTVAAVSVVRVRYDRGASFDVVGPAARLLAVESGALNVQVDDEALYRPAGAAPEQLPPTARVSLLPGGQLLVPGHGTIATRNVARGPSAALVVTVSQVYTAGPDQAVTVQR